jgi:hypothetical protein
MSDSVSESLGVESIRVGRGDLPWLARSASDAARGGQRWYTRLIATDLRLLIAASLVSAVELPGETAQRATAAAAAAFMALGLVLTSLTQQERRGHHWITSRAVAESAKGQAWRYMTRAEPYQGRTDSDDVDRTFVADLLEVLHDHKDFGRIVGSRDDATDQITPTMRNVRALDVEARSAIYRRDRLAAQQEYYRASAAKNQQSQQQWSLVIIAAQALGLFAAVAKAIWPGLQFSPAGVFATVVAATLAWTQFKQYQELSKTYGLAAHELALLGTNANFVRDDAELSAFVINAETVMSREHGQWVARRDHE